MTPEIAATIASSFMTRPIAALLLGQPEAGRIGRPAPVPNDAQSR
jgi:hypothetical protein